MEMHFLCLEASYGSLSSHFFDILARIPYCIIAFFPYYRGFPGGKRTCSVLSLSA
jgi:hypothetical protein